MAEKKSGRLLNPFAFPSETQLRSILLIWAILGLCWGVGFYFAKVLADTVDWPAVDKLPKLDRDILHIQEDRPSIVPSRDNVRKWLERMEAAYRKLEKPEGLARAQAAFADLSETAHFRWKVMLPYFLIPFFFWFSLFSASGCSMSSALAVSGFRVVPLHGQKKSLTFRMLCSP